MTNYPAFCATCYMTEHAGRACEADALELIGAKLQGEGR